MKKSSGFTLIELLVVIGILSAMMVWLIPQISSGQQAVQEAQCRKQLQDIYASITAYKSRHKGMPKNSGVTMLWDLWKSGAVENTDRGRRLFFCPGVLQAVSPPELEVPTEDIKTLWQNMDDFTNESTHYAVRAKKWRRSMTEDNAIWIADDNEGGRNHQSGAICILLSNGTPDTLLPEDLAKKNYWEAEPNDANYIFPVGEESPHPELQRLTPFADPQ